MRSEICEEGRLPDAAGSLQAKWRSAGAIVLVAMIGLVGEDVAAQDSSARAELVIAAGIENREPVGASQTFPADQEQVTAWTRIQGLEGTTVEHIWRYEDFEFIVPLEVGSPSWRTWSRKIIPSGWTGEWTVEIRDAEGNMLANTVFTVGD